MKSFSLNSFINTFIFLFISGAAIAEDIKDPGKQVQLTQSARYFEAARDSVGQCKASMIVPGGLTSKQRKAFINLRDNTCYCMANLMGELWESYGQDDLSTGVAMMRGEVNSKTCIDKYVTPYIIK